ncbi:MAG TPA: KEOPS complex subunit Pcc1 [Methanospirillum sp.]|nr:KEOPS complex subunit Pcc1 [Methanospirillum sp.]
MKITGIIRTGHCDPESVAASVAADNLRDMDTRAAGGIVETRITGTKIRSIIASVDDYLTNISVAEEVCRAGSDQTGQTRDLSRKMVLKDDME